MSHLEAASILLVGPTLKKFNDRDLSCEEIAIARSYPSHTALCIRGGWDLCRPEQAVDSTSKFLLEQWKEQIPSGYLLKKAFVDQPFEGDGCYCHFEFVRDKADSCNLELDLKYQWFIGERIPSNFTTISGANREFYVPKHDNIGRILKVECAPIVGDTKHPTRFAISSPVSPVYMYTPVTEEGAKGEPQYAITEYVKAAPPSVSNIQVIGDAVEGRTIRGLGEYFGGRQGPSKVEWLREDKDTGEFALVLTGTNEYILTKEDVGRQFTFVFEPLNVEGQEVKSLSIIYQVIKQAPPKVTNMKMIGEQKEGSKVTMITGGTQASSRVQWFKTSSSTFEGENCLEALSTSKIAKAFRIPLGAVGKYIVSKFTPMTPDGEAGEPAYVISEIAVDALPPTLNFLSVTGDYSEGGMLTATYGYIGGHEGKSIYNWYLHEVGNDSGFPMPEVSDLLQYRIPKDAIGKFISFTCTPVRTDGIVGEPRRCMGQECVRPGSPRLLSLQISGIAVEGTALNVEKRYWGGEEGESIYRWLQFLVSQFEVTGPVVPLSFLNMLDQLYQDHQHAIHLNFMNPLLKEHV